MADKKTFDLGPLKEKYENYIAEQEKKFIQKMTDDLWKDYQADIYVLFPSEKFKFLGLDDNYNYAIGEPSLLNAEPWNFAEILKSLMKAEGITRNSLAEMIEKNPVTITRWTNGDIIPGEKTMQQLATTLGVTVPYLTGEMAAEDNYYIDNRFILTDMQDNMVQYESLFEKFYILQSMGYEIKAVNTGNYENIGYKELHEITEGYLYTYIEPIIKLEHPGTYEISLPGVMDGKEITVEQIYKLVDDLEKFTRFCVSEI